MLVIPNEVRDLTSYIKLPHTERATVYGGLGGPSLRSG